MKRRVLIYGGTELSPDISAFVEALSYSFLQLTDLILVTGGFLTSDKVDKNAISTDVSILNGVKRYVDENKNVQVKDRLEVWLPDPELDRKSEKVIRFGLDKKIDEGEVTVFARKSAQARRLGMVKGVDAIITIKGKKNTALILELALTINKPALPLSFTEGDSETYLKDNKDQICESFTIEKDFAIALETAKPQYPLTKGDKELIEKLIDKTQGAIKRRCLVLMPFRITGANEFYENVIMKIAIEEGYRPIRIDEEINSGVIFMIFQERIKDTDCVLADITDINPNVMYELGYIRAQHNIKPVLFSRKKQINIEESLPFYLKDQKVDYFDEETDKDHADFITRISQHLEDRKEKF
jgi:hypothetical protein